MRDNDKLRALVHYICYNAEPSELGAIKLNKVLWYSDVVAYLRLGKPITEETYIKQEHGPVPKHILPILDAMCADGDLVIRKQPYFNYEKKEYITLTEPDLSVFAPEEVSIVAHMMHEICKNHTAKSISDASHTKVWELADIGDEMPMYMIHILRKGEINEHDVAWAKQSIATVGDAQ